MMFCKQISSICCFHFLRLISLFRLESYFQLLYFSKIFWHCFFKKNNGPKGPGQRPASPEGCSCQRSWPGLRPRMSSCWAPLMVVIEAEGRVETINGEQQDDTPQTTIGRQMELWDSERELAKQAIRTESRMGVRGKGRIPFPRIQFYLVKEEVNLLTDDWTR